MYQTGGLPTMLAIFGGETLRVIVTIYTYTILSLTLELAIKQRELLDDYTKYLIRNSSVTAVNTNIETQDQVLDSKTNQGTQCFY